MPPSPAGKWNILRISPNRIFTIMFYIYIECLEIVPIRRMRLMESFIREVGK